MSGTRVSEIGEKFREQERRQIADVLEQRAERLERMGHDKSWIEAQYARHIAFQLRLGPLETI